MFNTTRCTDNWYPYGELAGIPHTIYTVQYLHAFVAGLLVLRVPRTGRHRFSPSQRLLGGAGLSPCYIPLGVPSNPSCHTGWGYGYRVWGSACRADGLLMGRRLVMNFPMLAPAKSAPSEIKIGGAVRCVLGPAAETRATGPLSNQSGWCGFGRTRKSRGLGPV